MFKDFKTKSSVKIYLPIILIGIILRVVFYSFNRPFWNDECALALNIADFNIMNCFKPLLYAQAAPPLFLVISGVFAKIIPSVEGALRLFPLFLSVLSIFVFYDLSKRVLSKKSSIFLALILFCFNYRLVYYSQEFKQYSSDVLVFLSLLTSYFYIKIKNTEVKNLLLIGSGYAISIWLSFTSVFALFAVFCTLFFKKKNEYKKIFILFLPVIISFVCFYLLQHHLASSAELHTYWQNGFIAKNFSNFYLLVVNYFSYSFTFIVIFFSFLIALALKLFDIKSEKTLILLFPVITAVVLSYAHIYPLESRVSLYLIPICILFAASILDYVNFKHRAVNYILYFVIVLFLALPTVINTTYKLALKDFDKEDIVSPLNMAQSMIKEGDVLYIPDGSTISYLFYKKNYNFKNVEYEKLRINDSAEYIKYLDSLPKNKTYYYIYSHFPQKQQRLNDVYLWAKNKPNFKIYADKYSNALIVFTKS